MAEVKNYFRRNFYKFFCVCDALGLKLGYSYADMMTPLPSEIAKKSCIRFRGFKTIKKSIKINFRQKENFHNFFFCLKSYETYAKK